MAAVSIVPALIDALVARATTAINPDPTRPVATVYDGIGNSDVSGDYLMIGVDDPNGPEWAQSANVTRDWETVGLQNDIEEEGDIACVALSWNGSKSQKSARDAVYAIAEGLAGVCRTDPTLGLSNLLWVLYGGRSDLLQINNTNGVLARLEFQVHFRALI